MSASKEDGKRGYLEFRETEKDDFTPQCFCTIKKERWGVDLQIRKKLLEFTLNVKSVSKARHDNLLSIETLSGTTSFVRTKDRAERDEWYAAFTQVLGKEVTRKPPRPQSDVAAPRPPRSLPKPNGNATISSPGSLEGQFRDEILDRKCERPTVEEPSAVPYVNLNLNVSLLNDKDSYLFHHILKTMQDANMALQSNESCTLSDDTYAEVPKDVYNYRNKSCYPPKHTTPRRDNEDTHLHDHYPSETLAPPTRSSSLVSRTGDPNLLSKMNKQPPPVLPRPKTSNRDETHTKPIAAIKPHHGSQEDESAYANLPEPEAKLVRQWPESQPHVNVNQSASGAQSTQQTRSENADSTKKNTSPAPRNISQNSDQTFHSRDPRQHASLNVSVTIRKEDFANRKFVLSDGDGKILVMETRIEGLRSEYQLIHVEPVSVEAEEASFARKCIERYIHSEIPLMIRRFVSSNDNYQAKTNSQILELHNGGNINRK